MFLPNEESLMADIFDEIDEDLKRDRMVLYTYGKMTAVGNRVAYGLVPRLRCLANQSG